MSGRGGYREGSGRKKGGRNSCGSKAKSTGRIVVSCLESEEARIREMAREAGVSISRLVLDAVLKGRVLP